MRTPKTSTNVSTIHWTCACLFQLSEALRSFRARLISAMPSRERVLAFKISIYSRLKKWLIKVYTLKLPGSCLPHCSGKTRNTFCLEFHHTFLLLFHLLKNLFLCQLFGEEFCDSVVRLTLESFFVTPELAILHTLIVSVTFYTFTNPALSF